MNRGVVFNFFSLQNPSFEKSNIVFTQFMVSYKAYKGKNIKKQLKL